MFGSEATQLGIAPDCLMIDFLEDYAPAKMCLVEASFADLAAAECWRYAKTDRTVEVVCF